MTTQATSSIPVDDAKSAEDHPILTQAVPNPAHPPQLRWRLTLLEMDQSEISQLERRSDMLLSTLKRFVQATGGEMHLIVTYPDGGPVELLIGEE